MRAGDCPSRCRGFSLVELAIVLLVTGAIGAAVWQLVPTALEVGSGDAAAHDLASARDAVQGFALSRHRLPCPDGNDDGVEDCGSGGSDGFPWRTLETDRPPVDIRYTATGGLTDARDIEDFSPVLPPTSIYGSRVNGLDFCADLMGFVSAGGVSVGGGGSGARAAYVLAHPGDNERFEGGNTGSGFALPGARGAGKGDDLMVAVGSGELATALGCSSRLADVNAAAAAAFAAYEVDRVAGYETYDPDGDAELKTGMYLRFRDLALFVREGNVYMADVKLGLASVALVTSVASAVSDLALVAASKGAGALKIASTVVKITAAAGLVAKAVVKKVIAESRLEDARTNACNALRFAEKVKTSETATDGVDAQGRIGVECDDDFQRDTAGTAGLRLNAAEREASRGVLE